MTYDARRMPASEAGDAILGRFAAFADLTPGEELALRGLVGAASTFGAGATVRTEADERTALFVLHAGWALSSIVVPDGSRQALKLYRPGDVMGAPSLPFSTAVDSLTALTPIRASSISAEALGRLFAGHPRLGAVLFLIAQEERVTLMDRLVAVGRLDARRRVAALLLTILRGGPTSKAESSVYMPLTQAQIGDVLGLSAVHVNRVLGGLERDGLIRRDAHTYALLDVQGMDALVGLPRRVPRRNPAWLPASAP